MYTEKVIYYTSKRLAHIFPSVRHGRGIDDMLYYQRQASPYIILQVILHSLLLYVKPLLMTSRDLPPSPFS